MFDEIFDDDRPSGPADLIPEVTPELLVCTALVRTGRVDGCGASIIRKPGERFPLARTDDTFRAAAELQFSVWEGPGPEVVETGLAIVVDDLWAQSARWPLTTPRATELPMRALAVLPLITHGIRIGLFAAYRRAPVPFTKQDVTDLAQLRSAVGSIAFSRFHGLDQTAFLPASTVSDAVGMVMGHLGLHHDDALALLRTHACATDSTVPALAASLLDGTIPLDSLPPTQDQD